MDITAAFFACSVVLAALPYREKTGIGQRLDISLLDTRVAWLANQAGNYFFIPL